MCTLGPCMLSVEEFQCSNAGCSNIIETEGGEYCILFEKASAVTHLLLKREPI